MRTPVATLLPLTSCRNFKAALDFIDWLKRHDQAGWQMLPLSDPIQTPYRGHGIGVSSFFYDNHVPEQYRNWVLSRNDFLAQHATWLLDYALYRALSEYLSDDHWWHWPRELAEHQPDSIAHWRTKLADRISVYIDEQYFLYNQLLHLHRVAAENEIMIIGDLPFYVGLGSSLVWSHQHLFMIGEGGQLPLESGVPEVPGEPFGAQYWGHPLYDWENNELEEVLQIFYLRLEFMAGFCDLVRLDHANGFFRYGVMSREHPGWNRKIAGPDRPALERVLRKIQALHLGVYFEDIASDTMRLEQFMKTYDLSGTRVATLLYNVDAPPKKLPSEKSLSLERLSGNHLIFSSTHDTPTLLGWVDRLPPEVKRRLISGNQLAGVNDNRALAVKLRERILQLPARMTVIPWQDWQLDTFRFNIPGNEKLTRWDYYVDPRLDIKS